jgi:hypothetical protein
VIAARVRARFIQYAHATTSVKKIELETAIAFAVGGTDAPFTLPYHATVRNATPIQNAVRPAMLVPRVPRV